jgi:hypothetical protein
MGVFMLGNKRLMDLTGRGLDGIRDCESVVWSFMVEGWLGWIMAKFRAQIKMKR